MKNLFLALTAAALFCPAVSLAQDDKKPAAKAADSTVEVIKDVAYYDGKDADPVRHKLDLYLPKGKKDFPVLMFVHGGTWKSGKKDPYAPLGRYSHAMAWARSSSTTGFLRPSSIPSMNRTWPRHLPGRSTTSPSMAAARTRSSCAGTRRAGIWSRCWARPRAI